MRSSFMGKRAKSATGLPGARTNGTSVKVSASWNPFAQNSNKAGIVGSQGRDDYESEDVEYYFNYMGILAVEGSNDRMDDLLAAGKHPHRHHPPLRRRRGRTSRRSRRSWRRAPDVSVTDLDGKTPLMLAGLNNPSKKEVVEEMLKAKM